MKFDVCFYIKFDQLNDLHYYLLPINFFVISFCFSHTLSDSAFQFYLESFINLFSVSTISVLWKSLILLFSEFWFAENEGWFLRSIFLRIMFQRLWYYFIFPSIFLNKNLYWVCSSVCRKNKKKQLLVFFFTNWSCCI